MSEKMKEIVKNLKENQRFYTNEMAVRQGVILPILNHLDWETSNIKEVIPEYAVEKGRVDYCLSINGEHKVFIEVKRVAEDLDQHQVQLCSYAFAEGIKLAILTNGINWWFYLPLSEGNWDKRKFFAIDINQQEEEFVVSKLMYFLSRKAISTGSAIKNASKMHEGNKKTISIKETLPKAWKKIMEGPDDLFIDLIAETVESICCHRPDHEIVKRYIIEQSKPIIRKIESGGKETRNGINQFELTVPPAYIKWGGFPATNIDHKYLPNKEGKEHSFRINLPGFGETDAWMNQNRIKIPMNNWRQIMKKLDINAGDKFIFKVVKSLEHYEISKVN